MKFLKQANKVNSLLNEIRLINMQMKQLMPVFEIANDMSDNSVFNIVEYIWTKLYETYLPDVLDSKVSKSLFDYEIDKYITKDEAKQYDDKIK